MATIRLINFRRKISLNARTSIFFFIIIMVFVSNGSAFDLTKISKIEIKKIAVGKNLEFKAAFANFDLQLMGAYEEDNPRLFEGPLVIKKKGGNSSIEIDLSLIYALYGLENSNCIVVHTVSGSKDYFDIVDLSKGRQIHETIDAYSDKIDMEEYFLRIWPYCEATTVGEGDSCTAGRIYFFDKSNNYKPTLLESESREFNKEIIGIEFEGTKNIIEPKTKNARIGL
ncbi:MAG: hypothetical protein M0T82_01380 [Desulfobacteraceae bacterium]|nr:hypothetical protein [Desulfobacteraceae bacterium]